MLDALDGNAAFLKARAVDCLDLLKPEELDEARFSNPGGEINMLGEGLCAFKACDEPGG